MLWRSTTYTVQTEDARSNPRESFAADACRVEETINVIPGTFPTRQRAYEDFIGYSQRSVAGGGSGPLPYIQRFTPKPYDSFTNDLNKYYLYCVGLVNASPYGVATSVPGRYATDGPQARMVAVYRDLPYLIKEDAEVIAPAGAPSGALIGLPDEGYWLSQGWLKSRYVIKELSAGGGFITLRPGMMVALVGTTDSGNVVDAIPQGVPKKQDKAQVTYTWVQVPIEGVPWTTIGLTQGTVNNYAFDGYPAGVLLLGVPNYRIYNSPLGNKIADIKYPMTIRYNYSYGSYSVKGTPQGWNSILHVPAQGPYKGMLDYYPMGGLVATGSPPVISLGIAPYQESDFASLFRPQ
jgi:hypothetical protein